MPISGDVVDLELGTPEGREAGFQHPAVLVTAQRILDAAPSAMQVVPLTSTIRSFHSEVVIEPDDANGLKQRSSAQCQHLRSVSPNRIGGTRGMWVPRCSCSFVRRSPCCWIFRDPASVRTAGYRQSRWRSRGTATSSRRDREAGMRDNSISVQLAIVELYNDHMDVAVSTLRAHLSTWLERARDGEEIVVTDRGVPIARLVGVTAATRLERLAADGVIARPQHGQRPAATGTRRVRSRRLVSERISEQRR